MQTSRALPGLLLLGVLTAASPSLAFDPATANVDSPADAFWYGYDAYQNGDFATAVDAIQYAADEGYTRAQWMLGHMYANGDGVTEDDSRALQIFTTIADDHAEDNPRGDDAPFIADAMVTLGDYYRGGTAIPHPDADMARQLYLHAATVFDDPQAQYNLAQMFYDGEIGAADPTQAVRWARLAADSGDPSAQALLGHLLFEGEGISRQPVLGLAYLTIALMRSGDADDDLRRMHEEAFLVATEAERRTAQALADDWMAVNQPPTGLRASADTTTAAATPH